jgi:hydroxypyruvate isomerase
MMKSSRRHFLAGAGSGLLALHGSLHPLLAQAQSNGRLRQSVARWCFAEYPLDTLCEYLQKIGVQGIELVGPAFTSPDLDICKRFDITPCMLPGAGNFLPVEPESGRRFGPAFGWNRLEHHAELLEILERNASIAHAGGVRNVIGLFGDREGMSDAQGITNCVIGLRRAVPILEKYDVRLCIELLNSLVDHPDYQGNYTAYGVAVCEAVNSEHVKLIYDIYHMQVMEGNLIDTIRTNLKYIAHFQVAGVPGRNEIGANQEVNWPAVANAIADLGFDGFVGHEWLPTGADPLAELYKAVELLKV